MKYQRFKQVAYHADEELHQWLCGKARTEGRSLSTQTRIMLENQMRAEKSATAGSVSNDSHQKLA